MPPRRLLLMLLAAGLLLMLATQWGGVSAQGGPPTQTRWEVGDVTFSRDRPPVTHADDEVFSAVMSQNFEGAWPAPGWSLDDLSPDDGGNHLWGKRTCHPHTGQYGGWSTGGGAQGQALNCSADYPNDTFTWATYGPFDLSNADSATLTYHYWGRTEGGTSGSCPYDRFFVGSSIDNDRFSGTSYCGNWTDGTDGNGYYRRQLDLASRLGQSQVWIAFVLSTDVDTTFNGINIDDVSLDVTPKGAQATPTPTATPTSTPTVTPVGTPQFSVYLPWTMRIAPGYPAALSLSASQPTGGQVTLNWNGVADVITYVLWRSNTSDMTGAQVVRSGLFTQHTLTLSAGTHYFRVQAVNARGATASNTVAVTVQGPPTSIPPPTTVACPAFRAGRWEGDSTSFVVSEDRTRVLNFQRTSRTSCGTFTISVASLPINSCEFASSGQSGSYLISIRGTFTSETEIEGRTSISYGSGACFDRWYPTWRGP